MLAAREPVYSQAQITVDTNGRTPEEVVSAITGALERFNDPGGPGRAQLPTAADNPE